MGLAVIILVTLVAWMKSTIALDTGPFLCKDQPLVYPPNFTEVNATCYKKSVSGTGPCQLTPKQLLKVYKTPCYLACYFESVGVAKDGSINLAGLTSHVNAVYPAAASAIIEGTKLCTLPPPPKADECSCSPYKTFASCFKRSIKTNCKSLKGTSDNSTAAVPEKSRRRRAAETSTTIAKKNEDSTSSSEENDILPLAKN